MSYVISEKHGGITVLSLNRPESRNALNLEMVQELHQVLQEIEKDTTVQSVLLKGQGNIAFCAGGDVKKVVECLRKVPPDKSYATEFFRSEYNLDAYMHRYPKPLIALCYGIVMGGGLGLSNGAWLRVVDDSTVCAMPEVAIGFYPDVGATHFLNRIPSHIGTLIAMSGVSFKAEDMLWANLADAFLPQLQIESLMKWVGSMEPGFTRNEFRQSIQKSIYEEFKISFREKGLRSHFARVANEVESAFQNRSFHEIHQNILSFSDSKDAFLQLAAKGYASGSPLSARLAFEQLLRGREFGIFEALEFDKQFAPKFAENPDFIEGVRAKLIDKDMSPKWKHVAPTLVPENEVNQFFEIY